MTLSVVYDIKTPPFSTSNLPLSLLVIHLSNTIVVSHILSIMLLLPYWHLDGRPLKILQSHATNGSSHRVTFYHMLVHSRSTEIVYSYNFNTILPTAMSLPKTLHRDSSRSQAAFGGSAQAYASSAETIKQRRQPEQRGQCEQPGVDDASGDFLR